MFNKYSHSLFCMSIFLLDLLDESIEEDKKRISDFTRKKTVRFSESDFFYPIEKRGELFFLAENALWYRSTEIQSFHIGFNKEMRNVMKIMNIGFKEAKIFLYYISITIEDDDFDELFFF